MAHTNVFNLREPQLFETHATQEYTNVWSTTTIYANISLDQLQAIRRRYRDLIIGDRGPNNAIAIQGYRDQVLQAEFLNAFRRYDPNAYRSRVSSA